MNFPNKIMSFSLFSLRESTIIALTVLLSWGLMAGAGTQCYAFQIIAFAGVILFGLNTKRFFWWLIFPLIVVFSLYFPVGFSFGPVSKGYISALIATTATETYDFLASTPFWHFIVPVILIASSVLLKTYVQREKIVFCTPKYIALYGSALILSSLFFSLSGVDSTRKLMGYSKILPFWKLIVFFAACSLPILLFKMKQARFLAFIPIVFTCSALLCANISKDLHLVRKGPPYFLEILKENKKLQETVKTNDWIITSSQQKYKIYLIVIGESVRRDYMHAYGYPVKNTDFMDSVPGVVFNGFTSEGDGTIESLRRALTHSRPSGNSVNFSLNLVGLAKKAGLSTAWFSNQGFATDCDTPVSAIAFQSERAKWLEMSLTSHKSDEALLELLDQEVHRPDSRSKLIVLHLHGSHPSVCSSVKPEVYENRMHDSFYRESFCYVESIRNTDLLLSKAYSILRDNGNSFSMIYFSDHGLSHNIIGNALTLKHANPTKPHRDIPLFCASSDDTMHTSVKSRRFADSFTEGVAHWLGITTQQIPNPRNLFAPVPDNDIHGYKTLWNSRKEDPAVNIQEH